MRLILLLLFIIVWGAICSGGTRSSPTVSFEPFIKALAATWSNITERNPSELISSITTTLSMHTMGQVISRHALGFSDLCMPASLKRVVKSVDTAVHMLQLAYDPNNGAHIMGIGPLQGYKIEYGEPVAKRFQPAHTILRNTYNSSVLWVVVRGTNSTDDIFTDLTIDPESFMDGHVHKGILLSAQYIAKRVMTIAGASKTQIYLTGHSLGGGAAALAAVMLRNEGYAADAVTFGPPSCVTPGRWMQQALQAYVTSIIVDADIVPRLTNESVSHLLRQSVDVYAAFRYISGAFESSFMTAFAGNPALANLAGVKVKPCISKHCPPGRLYVMERAKDTDWGVKEVTGADLSEILLVPSMFSDHTIESYSQAIQQAHLRHKKVCGVATSAKRREL